MSEREQFEAWWNTTGRALCGCSLVPDHSSPNQVMAARGFGAGFAAGFEAARAQPAQAGHVPEASCGECGKKTSDGWALYCVACMEEAGLPAQAVPLLSDDPLFVFAKEVIHGAYKPDELKDAAMRAIRHHSAVRAKLLGKEGA